MIFTVIWTPRAEETFNKNIEYLEQDWDNQVLQAFFNRVDEVVDTMAQDPQLFPLHKSSKVIRRCVVTEHITLYYKLKNDFTIDLLTFWNVYQNPKKLKL
jgi:plasmid stabilization system protein ParE